MLTWLLFVLAHRQFKECGASLVTTVTIKRTLRHQQKGGEPTGFVTMIVAPRTNFGKSQCFLCYFPLNAAKRRQTKACLAHASVQVSFSLATSLARNLRVFVLQFPQCMTESLETPTLFPEFGPGRSECQIRKNGEGFPRILSCMAS